MASTTSQKSKDKKSTGGRTKNKTQAKAAALPADPTDSNGAASHKRQKLDSVVAGLDAAPEPAAPIATQPVGWGDVAAHLAANRRRLRRVWDWRKPTQAPLLWELPLALAAEVAPWCKALATVWAEEPASDKAYKRVAQKVEDWVTQLPTALQQLSTEEPAQGHGAPQASGAGRVLGLQAVAVAWLLPALTEPRFQATVEQALAALLELCETAVVPGDDPLVSSLWQIELPLTLATWLPGEIFPTSLRGQALTLLQRQLEELTDGNGLPAGRDLPRFVALLAGWTRIYRLERWIGDLMANAPCRDRFRYAFEQSLRLLRSDGTPLLRAGRSSSIHPGMVAAWLRIGDDSEERGIVELACPAVQELVDVPGLRLKESKLADAADYSEWAKLAILRTRWKRKSDKLAVDFGQRDVRIELENKDSWLLGNIETQITADGQRIELSDSWEEICWQSDEETIYLEIQNDLLDGRGILQRQFSLSRRDRLCLLIDAVILNEETPAEPSGRPAAPAANHRSLTHLWRCPLGPGVRLKSAAETRECWLTDGDLQLSVVPWTQPEWRVQYSHSKLTANEGRLQLEMTLPSHRLCQGLLIDLDAKRSRQPLTWQTLTVGENLSAVPIDQAVAARVQLHREHFLLYRSLTPPSSRSFLGQNVYADFYWGRFQADGTAESIIMIESE